MKRFSEIIWVAWAVKELSLSYHYGQPVPLTEVSAEEPSFLRPGFLAVQFASG